MTSLPNFSCYTDHSSKNYGLNSLVFTDPQGNDFYFSYKTLVAFRKAGSPVVYIENQWGPTTGKHLNEIRPDKKKRVGDAEFSRLYREAFPD